MTERLFGSNRHYVDAGDFTQRYFYQLRGCVAPVFKTTNEQTTPPSVMPRKSQRQMAMDAAREKTNKRNKRKI